MAAHSSILAWQIPWTEEPGGLQSMGSQSWTQLREEQYNSTATRAELIMDISELSKLGKSSLRKKM